MLALQYDPVESAVGLQCTSVEQVLRHLYYTVRTLCGTK